jgi:hypothetical protein
MMTIIAISGWAAFLFVAVLYRIGNKINVEETTALEAFSLALLLSDEFRAANRDGIQRAICVNAPSSTTDTTMWGIMTTMLKLAKNYYRNWGNERTDVDTLILNRRIIDKMRNADNSGTQRG